MRYLRRCLVALSGLLIPVAPASSQTVSVYTAPTEFMNLFFDFTGSNEAGYPAGQPTLGQMLTQSVIAKEVSAVPAPLVLIVGSDIYVYDSGSGALLSHEQFRDDRTSGFFEMTAISHIGPALAYLAQIKANGDTSRRCVRSTGAPPTTGLIGSINRRGARARCRSEIWSTMRVHAR